MDRKNKAMDEAAALLIASKRPRFTGSKAGRADRSRGSPQSAGNSCCRYVREGTFREVTVLLRADSKFSHEPIPVVAVPSPAAP